MNKIKSIARKLLGKSAPQPFRIDSVAQTVDGFCIVGWYFTNQVKRISVLDANSKPLASDIIDIERSDVAAATGQNAKGFQLTVTTACAIEDLMLSIQRADGNAFTSRLTLMGEVVPVENEKVSTKTRHSLEYVIAVDGHLCLVGWVLDGGTTKEFTLNTNKATYTQYSCFRYSRSDVNNAFSNEPGVTANAGFMLVFSSPDFTAPPNAKSVKLQLDLDGKNEVLVAQQVFDGKADPMTNVQRLLNNWQSTSPSQLQKGEMFLPVLHGIYPANASTDVTEQIYGVPSLSPAVSVIIPLYGRIDFMRYQLSNFARYVDKDTVEVIYVLDDPKLANQARKLASELETVTAFPFKLILLSKNVGFGRANNIGVKHARADTLLLLNSDILPKNKGWIASLQESLNKPTTGIVGARLLFEDETIQHDGMAPMHVKEHPGLWFNDHPKKGWPKHIAYTNQHETECPLLTAACWMLRKEDFNAVGGFDPVYVLGDFEDSDLCFKIEALGKKNVIRHDIELYHLERQSQNLVQPGRWKHNVTVLNAMTYNNRWKDQLSAMKEKV